jgi:hypothetical protein
METLLLQSPNKKDIKMLAELAKKIGFSATFISNDAMEDIALATAMKKGRTGEYVDTPAFLKKLKGK